MSLGRDRELNADDDAHHRVTEQTNVQRGKQHEDDWKLDTDLCAILHSNVRATRKNLGGVTAFTDESTLKRSIHAEDFVSEVEPAEAPAAKSNGDQM